LDVLSVLHVCTECLDVLGVLFVLHVCIECLDVLDVLSVLNVLPVSVLDVWIQKVGARPAKVCLVNHKESENAEIVRVFRLLS